MEIESGEIELTNDFVKFGRTFWLHVDQSLLLENLCST